MNLAQLLPQTVALRGSHRWSQEDRNQEAGPTYRMPRPDESELTGVFAYAGVPGLWLRLKALRPGWPEPALVFWQIRATRSGRVVKSDQREEAVCDV